MQELITNRNNISRRAPPIPAQAAAAPLPPYMQPQWRTPNPYYAPSYPPPGGGGGGMPMPMPMSNYHH